MQKIITNREEIKLIGITTRTNNTHMFEADIATNAIPITKQFIKIKFCDFKSTTAEVVSKEFNEQIFYDLLNTGFGRNNKPIRLLGVGVRF